MGITYNKKTIKKDRVVTGHGPRDLQNKRQVPIPVQGDAGLVNELRRQIEALNKQLAERPAPDGMFTPEQVDEELAKAIMAETSQLKLEHEKVLKALELDNIKLSNQIITLTKEKDELKAKLQSTTAGNEAKIDSVVNEVKLKYDRLLEDRDARLESLQEAHRIETDALKERVSDQAALIETLKDLKSSSSPDTAAMEKLIADTAERLERAAASMGTGEGVIDADRPQMEDVFIDPLEEKQDLEHKIIVEDVSPSKKEDMATKVDKLKNLMGKLPTKR